MTKKYHITVDCAACANQMERAAARVEGVRKVSVNFMMETMTVSFDDDCDIAVAERQIERACSRIEREFALDE